jgi:regulatory protein YycH of two-component signal transduction system YycFG
MKTETVKSIILAVLVLISIFFTWNIWTYQPNYNEIQNTKYVENNPLSNVTKKIHEVILPMQLLVHENQHYYGTYDEELISNLWEEMRKWELRRFRNISDEIKKEFGFYQWLNGQVEGDHKFICFMFSDTIPLSSLNTVTEWTEKDTYNIKFDRLFIPFSNDSSNHIMYFVDVENEYVVQAEIESALSETWKVIYDSAKNDFHRFILWNDRIYLPEKPLPMKGEKYITKFLSGERFKEVLFSNPSYVKKDVNGSEYIYTDSSRQLVINEGQGRVLYVNPTIDQSLTTEKGKLILQSIDFLNAHGGWISGYNDYKYFTTDQEQKIYYRLTVNHFPVFSFTDSHYTITSIIQSWGNNEIALYQRPLFYLDDFIQEEEMELPGSDKVIAAIENDSSIDEYEIKRIFPSYDIQSTTQPNIVYLHPVWCIELTNGKYQMINMKNAHLGGDDDGLE